MDTDNNWRRQLDIDLDLPIMESPTEHEISPEKRMKTDQNIVIPRNKIKTKKRKKKKKGPVDDAPSDSTSNLKLPIALQKFSFVNTTGKESDSELSRAVSGGLARLISGGSLGRVDSG